MRNQELLSLPFDLYERYQLLPRIGELFAERGSTLRVLDVSGRHAGTRDSASLVSAFLPNAECVVADLGEGGCAVQLPFRDESFDLVCSLETLERLPEEDRLPALAELLRVTKNGLYLIFADGCEARMEAERLAAEVLDHYLQEAPPQLLDHPAKGLPDRNRIESYLREAGFPPVSFGQGNTDVRALMTLTCHTLRNRVGEESVRLLNRRFNSAFAPRDFEEPTSLVCMLLSKREPLHRLEALRELLVERAAGALRNDEILHLCELLLLITTRGSDRNFVRMERELRAQAERLHRLEGQIDRTARSVDEMRQSRIWRALVGIGGGLLSLAKAPKKQTAAEPPVLLQPDVTPYGRWISAFEQRDERQIQLRLAALPRKPVISVLIAACDADQTLLAQAVDSVRAQSYPHWELCIAGLAGAPHGSQDDRIKVQVREGPRDVAAALTAASEAATGEYIVLLEHDARISKDALLEIAGAIATAPDADFVYSDHDCLDDSGRRVDPFFKPDWSPDLLLSQNYIAHLVAFRKELLLRAGGFRGEFEGSWEYDLVLRLTEKSARVVHIPKILCHLRTVPSAGSQAQARRAIEEHLRRGAVNAIVEKGRAPGLWRVRYAIDAGCRVSILIPSGGATSALETCLDGLAARTEYENFEVVVIDNSKHDEIEKLARQWGRGKMSVRYLSQRGRPFNYSALNNVAARQCDSPLLLFLNDDVSPLAPDWLAAMIELAARDEVGAVGAKLLYPNGPIQHAGVVLGIQGCCGHAFLGVDDGKRHYFDFPDVIRNVSAVTGACMMVRSKVFWEVGGFDEENLPVAFNDIDLCLKIGRKGYRVLYTPYAVLDHCEAFSKTAGDLIPTAAEVLVMRTKWPEAIRADPFYSPNLALDRNDYSLRSE